MDRRTVLAISGLIVGSSYLSLTYDKSFAFERPIHTSSAILAIAGIILIGWNRVCRLIWRKQPAPPAYSVLPLEEIRSEPQSPISPRPRSPHPSPHPLSPRPLSPRPRTPIPSSPISPRFANGNGFHKRDKSKSELVQPPSSKRIRVTWLLLVVAICCRVKVFHWIVRESQCASKSYLPAIPFILAMHDFWTARRYEQHFAEEGGNTSRFGAFFRRFTHSRYRFILPTACLAFGSAITMGTISGPRSTFICAEIFKYRGVVPTIQVLAAILDCCIIFLATSLAVRGKANYPHEPKSYSSIGWACLVSSTVLTTGGALFVLFRPQLRYWAFSLSFYYIRSFCALASAALLTGICALYALDGVGALTTSVIVAFTCTFIRDFDWAWNNRGAYPPIPAGFLILGICFYLFGAFFYTRTKDPPEEFHVSRNAKRSSPSRSSGWISITILMLFAVRLFLALSQASQIYHHPIDTLISDAGTMHANWLKKASLAESLADALSQYRIRYHRPPPPNFDTWFEWAKSKRTLIMNDFDQVYDDLAPFWGMDPSEIRQQTWDLIVNPANNVGGVLIRGGHASVAPNVPSEHKRKLDGVVNLINKFAAHIPDMDLAFNVDDSPRVAVPYHNLKFLRDAALRTADDRNTKDSSFSGDRGGQWQSLPDDPVKNPAIFEDHMGQQIFNEWASASCPTMSTARLESHWDLAHLCTICTRLHSDPSGAFVANWTLAQSPCHQPDIASLHGLYFSPSSMRVHHNLLPVFSHTKAQGFQDILYPSAEEYTAGSDVYAPTDEHPDPPFSEKEPTLYFRGAPSEGITAGGNTWRGFLRQRIIHLLSPDVRTGTTSPILLPTPSEGTFKFFNIPDWQLRNALPTDAKFTDITHCTEADCNLERKQFEPAIAQAPPFQDLWRYKYLLDLDGSGRDSRFLPFLRSHSLVFRAGILRNWWSSRVTAWKHFIPIDLRGHGLFPTLAYFRGFPGTRGSLPMPPHEDAAQRIAEDGKRWAERVLRREDMEVYMFRLLLEWGRITDERRDEIGFGSREKWWEGTRVGIGQGRGDKKKSKLAGLIGGF